LRQKRQMSNQLKNMIILNYKLIIFFYYDSKEKNDKCDISKQLRLLHLKIFNTALKSPACFSDTWRRKRCDKRPYFFQRNKLKKTGSSKNYKIIWGINLIWFNLRITRYTNFCTNRIPNRSCNMQPWIIPTSYEDFFWEISASSHFTKRMIDSSSFFDIWRYMIFSELDCKQFIFFSYINSFFEHESLSVTYMTYN